VLCWARNVREVALICLHLTLEIDIDFLPAKASLNLSSSGVKLPVGDSIANHPALERNWDLRRRLGSVVGVDLVDQGRNVDASVGLARDVEVVLLEIRELFVPLVQGEQVFFGSGLVGELVVVSVEVGVTHSCWHLQVEHVCVVVPRVRVSLESLLSVVVHKRPVLLSKSKH